MADGLEASFACEAHPDPHVEAVRGQLVRAEVRQAALRVRPYDRTPANPVEMHVFSDIDIGLPVNRLLRWKDAVSTLIDNMAVRGVVFAASAKRAYPDLAKGTERTMRGRLARELASPTLFESVLRDWRKIGFRLTNRTKDDRAAYTQTAWVAPDERDPGAAIATRLAMSIEWRPNEGDEWRLSEPTHIENHNILRTELVIGEPKEVVRGLAWQAYPPARDAAPPTSPTNA
jgi:hypothetical protein